MMLQLVHDLEARAARPFIRCLDVRNRRHDEAQVVEPLPGFICGGWRAMQREVVRARAQIRVVGVGLPDHLHPEYANVKVFRALEVGNFQRQMTHPAIFDQLYPSRVRYPTTAQTGSDGGVVGAPLSINSIFSNPPLSIK